MSRVNGNVVWGPIFRRNLRDAEVNMFQDLLAMLNGYYNPVMREDKRVSMGSKDGPFLVTLFYKVIAGGVLSPPSPIARFWAFKVPPISFGNLDYG